MKGGKNYMDRKLKIMVGCGSGIATATVAADAVRRICDEEGFDAEVITCRMFNLPEYDTNDTVDILLSTSKIKEEQYKKPVMSIFGLISGIGEDKIRARLIEMINKVLEES
jgi:PTS system galactitol-specific IIB component